MALATPAVAPWAAEVGSLFIVVESNCAMALLLSHSIHTGHYRIARQPRAYRGKQAMAWAKVEVAFSRPVHSLSYWALVDAINEGEQARDALRPHAFLGYCVRQGWLERV